MLPYAPDVMMVRQPHWRQATATMVVHRESDCEERGKKAG
jgi:hypothetical protein